MDLCDGHRLNFLQIQLQNVGRFRSNLRQQLSFYDNSMEFSQVSGTMISINMDDLLVKEMLLIISYNSLDKTFTATLAAKYKAIAIALYLAAKVAVKVLCIPSRSVWHFYRVCHVIYNLLLLDQTYSNITYHSLYSVDSMLKRSHSSSFKTFRCQANLNFLYNLLIFYIQLIIEFEQFGKSIVVS
jgi:hypothetical protein